MSKVDIISLVCEKLDNNCIADAKKIINKQYPFKKTTVNKRSYSKAEMLQIFVRDGFIDRYTGNKLIFPGTLRILSELMPQEFPYHLNWKMDACHIAWWQLSPTIDHILPIAKGGNNEPDNLVCTSMLKNKTKDNFLLDELGWNLFPAGDFEKWDVFPHNVSINLASL
ncbi:HNH endonuclease [Pectinatus frisingensis]|uniref:HNH endonuclease n=1 Tax=Pectinatus frisingensis TaxID=865 RepID=UPI003D807399